MSEKKAVVIRYTRFLKFNIFSNIDLILIGYFFIHSTAKFHYTIQEIKPYFSDNALLTQSRFILMESILIQFLLVGLLCVMKFRKVHDRSIHYNL